MSDAQSPLRLRKKHGGGKPVEVTSADAAGLVNAQSVRNAVMVAVIVVIVFSVFTIALSELTKRILPWVTVVLGLLLGHAIRIAGRGVDWRFPSIAAVSAIAGSLLVNVVLAASVSAESMGVSTLEVLTAVTNMTWPVFFDERLNTADIVYAVMGAALAAFYSNRRLTRAQYRALRLWQEEHGID